jgi:EAL domain-containing protein (putative c-di-GMP-specific phosphodiesterase class I)
MVDLSLTVGAQAIAEQVETGAVAETMRALGVHYGQGWLFGRPLPAIPAVGQPRPAPARWLAKRQGVREEWR